MDLFTNCLLISCGRVAGTDTQNLITADHDTKPRLSFGVVLVGLFTNCLLILLCSSGAGIDAYRI